MNVRVTINPMERVPGLPDIQAAQRVLAQAPQETYPVVHHWADGVYGREVIIQADQIVVGKLHRKKNLNILLAGTVIVASPGQKAVEITGPHVFVANPGAKRIVRTVTEVRWLVVHGTEETDLAAIEAQVIEPEGLLLSGGGK